jgi:hypothetical protein
MTRGHYSARNGGEARLPKIEPNNATAHGPEIDCESPFCPDALFISAERETLFTVSASILALAESIHSLEIDRKIWPSLCQLSDIFFLERYLRSCVS